MSKTIDAMKQALSALGPDETCYREERVDRAMSALRDTIIQAQTVEPVAWESRSKNSEGTWGAWMAITEPHRACRNDTTALESALITASRDPDYFQVRELFTHPAPVTEPAKSSAGERDELIVDLTAWADSGSKTLGYLVHKALKMLAADALEIERLKIMSRMLENISTVSTGKEVAKMLKERDQLKAKNDSLLSWLGSNMTFYDVNTQCSTQHPNIPVLASVSKRIWYHATDNQLDFPFSQVVRSALQTPQTDAQQVVVLTDVAPQGYGELIKLAAWLLSPGPMWAIDELEGQTHIGHRQFSKAKNTMRDVICMKAIEIKGIADTLSVAPQGNKS